MEKTLEIINRMEAEGLIGRYAIGDAVAAVFYVEPFATFDLDIFFAAHASGGPATMTPVYEYLSAAGYEAKGEAVNIEGWPVQLIPTYNPLVAEAVEQAESSYERRGTSEWLRRAQRVCGTRVAVCGGAARGACSGRRRGGAACWPTSPSSAPG